MAYVRGIPVRDAHGDELTVHEFRERQGLRSVAWFELDSGEPVELLDKKHFRLASGEVLTRIDR